MAIADNIRVEYSVSLAPLDLHRVRIHFVKPARLERRENCQVHSEENPPRQFVVFPPSKRTRKNAMETPSARHCTANVTVAVCWVEPPIPATVIV
jgi:hypothetical protein